jgi:hypothetical protein
MFIENNCLNGIKGSKKDESRYKAMNGKSRVTTTLTEVSDAGKTDCKREI